MRGRYELPCGRGVRLTTLFLVCEVCECVSTWFWSSYVGWYVYIVGFEDVEETVDVCLLCCIFDFLFILFVDTHFVEVFILGFFVDRFGA